MQTEDEELTVKFHFPSMHPQLMQQFPAYPLQKHHLGREQKVQEERNELVFGLSLNGRFQRSLEKSSDV